ncbi:putative Protein tyrosine kinase [Paratrimastix pyriformis]|uniref:Protein kinase domain-containing protein n=1 Tax=Paratrimastix pyriformis TaxID=342808 RepID=A0ABQ8ULR9_9EUKA|nr:putative Protein tyrosine kinase [Paratrimastix pyriformis]
MVLFPECSSNPISVLSANLADPLFWARFPPLIMMGNRMDRASAMQGDPIRKKASFPQPARGPQLALSRHRAASAVSPGEQDIFTSATTTRSSRTQITPSFEDGGTEVYRTSTEENALAHRIPPHQEMVSITSSGGKTASPGGKPTPVSTASNKVQHHAVSKNPTKIASKKKKASSDVEDEEVSPAPRSPPPAFSPTTFPTAGSSSVSKVRRPKSAIDDLPTSTISKSVAATGGVGAAAESTEEAQAAMPPSESPAPGLVRFYAHTTSKSLYLDLAPRPFHIFRRSLEREFGILIGLAWTDEAGQGHPIAGSEEIARAMAQPEYKERYRYRMMDVAIKTLRDVSDGGSLALFKREALLLEKLPPHPNVVAFYGVTRGLDEAPESLALIIEYVPGGSLAEYLRTFQGTMPPEEASRLALQIASGMAHIHSQGICHRDLAARNILLDANRNAKPAVVRPRRRSSVASLASATDEEGYQDNLLDDGEQGGGSANDDDDIRVDANLAPPPPQPTAEAEAEAEAGQVRFRGWC